MDNIDLLLSLDKPVPRYTSYPTAPEWGPITPSLYLDSLAKVDKSVALYLHIPFCKSMCLFCGCSVILNRKEENEERYVDYLIKEMKLASRGQSVSQLHFGGGTPTKLSCRLIEKVMGHIHSLFSLEKGAEIAIEIDPRTVHEDRGEKLTLLRSLGFTRVSFGVQDTNEKVQEAVKRRQSYEMTKYTFELAKELGFEGINLDLIYGLPFQTVETFTETISKIIALCPDRLSLFSYAKIPWMKPHQKAIPDDALPSTEEKFKIYLLARKALLEAGYKAIGMDHFALPTDEMALAFSQKKLQRNFQGYTVLDVEDLISFGITAIGYVQNGYFQNVKELETYYQMLDNDTLPVFRGKILHEDDKIRRWVVQRLMCDFMVNKEEFSALFSQDFDHYFAEDLLRLEPLILQGLAINGPKSLSATDQGSLFIRNITACFDYYLAQKEGHKAFSKAI